MKKIITVLLSGIILFTLVSTMHVTPEISAENHLEINAEMFEQTSGGYHRDIALIASTLSEACYNGYTEVNNAYENLGFDIKNDVTLFSYSGAENNADYDTNLISTEEDSLAFSLATREIADRRLLVITLRGTDLTSTNDILHDISIFGSPFYENSSPTGFLSFFKKVSVGLSLYISEHPEIAESADSGNLRILITGHSLGAAGANLLGAYFNTHDNNSYSGFDGNEAVRFMYDEILDIPQEDIFVYTFACPNVYYGDPTTAGCDNIINVINESDLIPQVPSGKKFGQFVYFDTQDDNGLLAHYGYKYINAVDSDIPDGVRYYGGGVDAEINENTFRHSSDKYNGDIAKIAVALSSASYNGRREAGYYINSAYRQLGFKSENIAVYGYPSDNYSFSFANGTFGNTDLLAVTLKGNSGQNGFYSEINSGFTQEFHDSATNENYYNFEKTVMNTLSDYLAEHSEIKESAENGTLKILVSGHSIGGATAQLVGYELELPDSPLKISPDDIFVYTFGCPYVFGKNVSNDRSNVFNIINESDFVTLMPFGIRSGKNVYFDTGNFGENNHEPKIYADDVMNDKLRESSRQYRKITLNCSYADVEILEDNVSIGKITENKTTGVAKILQGDTNKYIFLPSDIDYSIRFSGVQDEIIKLTAEDSDGVKMNVDEYKNVELSDGKVIEYRIKKGKNIDNAELLVLDGNGNPAKIIDSDGTEREYTEKSARNIKPLVFGGISAVTATLLATVLIFSFKKKDEKGD